jgi:biopolymer transport protein ExbB
VADDGRSLSRLGDFVAWLDGGATGALMAGGPAIWAIAALSVVLLALILWKTWRLALTGAFAGGSPDGPESGAPAAGRGVRGRFAAASMRAIREMPEGHAREEITRLAKRELAEARAGLRAIELIALIAPLLGLLGTVLGMIAAFRTLQETGVAADPSDLAGGIWEALLTTAAGMAVAIPATIALTWFEGVCDRLRLDLEDIASRAVTSRRTQARSPGMLRAGE